MMSKTRLHHNLNKTSVNNLQTRVKILTQSTAPGKVISVAKNTISSPCKVVIDLCASQRCCMTFSRLPCHLHDAPGHGHIYFKKQMN